MVGGEGLEPSHLAVPAPKAGASTSFATRPGKTILSYYLNRKKPRRADERKRGSGGLASRGGVTRVTNHAHEPAQRVVAQLIFLLRGNGKLDRNETAAVAVFEFANALEKTPLVIVLPFFRLCAQDAHVHAFDLRRGLDREAVRPGLSLVRNDQIDLPVCVF